jgi:hypothetical protein
LLGTGVTRSDSGQSLYRIPLYARSHPHWFVEGVAQFDTRLLGRDDFDENRRAFERAAWEDGLYFPLGKLAFYGGEKWYNTGFSFLLYLEERFGDSTVHRLFHASGESYYLVFDHLFEDVLGVPLAELEADFRARVQQRFDAHVGAAHAGLYDGKPVALHGVDIPYWDLTPQQRDDLQNDYRAAPRAFSGGRLLYQQGGDIKAAVFDPETRTLGEPDTLSEGFAVAPHAPGSYFILRYADDEPDLLPYFHRPGYESAGLFLVDEEGEERRLVDESGFTDIDVCPGRAELAATVGDRDGGVTLALYPLERAGQPDVRVATERARFPLDARPFDHVSTPRYSPDCQKLFFARREGDDHDLFYYDFQLNRVVPFATEDAFELDPEPTERGVYYVSARDGTMSLYFRAYGAGRARRVTHAITAHHRPVAGAGGLFFARLRGTGFQIHHQRADWLPPDPAVALNPKPPELSTLTTPLSPDASAGQGARDYHPFDPDDVLAPSFVPMLDVIYDTTQSYREPLQVQAGVEMYVEDQLDRHSLLLRGLIGNRSSLWAGYENRMTPLNLQLRAGYTDIRSLYTYDPPNRDDVYEHVSDYGWGFLYAAAVLPLSTFHSVSLSAETLVDVGTTLGARERPYTLADPRLARDILGLSLSYSGLDRTDPTFREREVNKRGYREYDLRLYGARERVHPLLVEQNDRIRRERTPYLRAQLRYTEFIALPELSRGFFDHTLQLDLQLGYISSDITFLPFFGGGRLFSLTSPDQNTSVGFVGYSSFALAAETLANAALTYRFPLLRNLSLDWGPLYLEDIYAQVFTSWGNIWGYSDAGERQIPFVDRAENGRHIVGDVGLDIRLLTFFQEIESNVGTTLRAAYRLVPFTACPGDDPQQNPACLGVDGERGFLFYLIVGGGY